MTRAALLIIIVCFGLELFLFGFEIAAYLLFFTGFSNQASDLFRDPAWRGLCLYRSGRWKEAADSFARDPSSSYNMGNALTRAGLYPEAIEAYERALEMDPGNSDAAFNKSLLEAAIKHPDRAISGRDTGSLSASPAIKAGGSRERPQTDGGAGGSGEGLASGNQTQGPVSPGGRVTKNGAESAEQKNPGPGSAAGAAGAFGDAGRSGEIQPNFPDLLQERQSRMRRRQQDANVHPSLEWLETLADNPGQFLRAKISAEKARRLKDAGGSIPEDD